MSRPAGVMVARNRYEPDTGFVESRHLAVQSQLGLDRQQRVVIQIPGPRRPRAPLAIAKSIAASKASSVARRSRSSVSGRPP